MHAKSWEQFLAYNRNLGSTSIYYSSGALFFKMKIVYYYKMVPVHFFKNQSLNEKGKANV